MYMYLCMNEYPLTAGFLVYWSTNAFVHMYVRIDLIYPSIPNRVTPAQAILKRSQMEWNCTPTGSWFILCTTTCYWDRNGIRLNMSGRMPVRKCVFTHEQCSRKLIKHRIEKNISGRIPFSSLFMSVDRWICCGKHEHKIEIQIKLKTAKKKVSLIHALFRIL